MIFNLKMLMQCGILVLKSKENPCNFFTFYECILLSKLFAGNGITFNNKVINQVIVIDAFCSKVTLRLLGCYNKRKKIIRLRCQYIASIFLIQRNRKQQVASDVNEYEKSSNYTGLYFSFFRTERTWLYKKCKYAKTNEVRTLFYCKQVRNGSSN